MAQKTHDFRKKSTISNSEQYLIYAESKFNGDMKKLDLKTNNG